MKEPREEINEELKRLDEISDVFLENMDLKHELAKAKDRIKELEKENTNLKKRLSGDGVLVGSCITCNARYRPDCARLGHCIKI